MSDRADIAVVVITRNRLGDLMRMLELLGKLPEQPQVVVVDNGSTDRTVGAVRRLHPEVGVVALRRDLGSAARNAGVRQVTAPYVAFSDEDSWWAPGSVADSLRFPEWFRRSGRGVAAR